MFASLICLTLPRGKDFVIDQFRGSNARDGTGGSSLLDGFLS